MDSYESHLCYGQNSWQWSSRDSLVPQPFSPLNLSVWVWPSHPMLRSFYLQATRGLRLSTTAHFSNRIIYRVFSSSKHVLIFFYFNTLSSCSVPPGRACSALHGPLGFLGSIPKCLTSCRCGSVGRPGAVYPLPRTACC